MSNFMKIVLTGFIPLSFLILVVKSVTSLWSVCQDAKLNKKLDYLLLLRGPFMVHSSHFIGV